MRPELPPEVMVAIMKAILGAFTLIAGAGLALGCILKHREERESERIEMLRAANVPGPSFTDSL